MRRFFRVYVCTVRRDLSLLALVAVLFHVSGSQGSGEVVCLWVALGLAAVAGVMSLSRIKELSPIGHSK